MVDNMENSYKITLTKKHIFILFAITIIIVAFFSKLNVQSGIFVGIFISSVTTIYLLNVFMTEQKKQNNEQQIKQSSIYPQTENILKYNDITDFLFSIQDLYIISPQIYEELVGLLDEFIVLYEDGINYPPKTGINLSMAQNIITLSMNTIHSFVYNISSPVLINKIQISASHLNNILNGYILKMYDVYKIQLDNNEINRNTRLINLSDPQPYIKSPLINEQYQYYV